MILKTKSPAFVSAPLSVQSSLGRRLGLICPIVTLFQITSARRGFSLARVDNGRPSGFATFMRFHTGLYSLLVGYSLIVVPLKMGAVDARLMRDPAVSETQIAFVYAGDIWIVAKIGGTAQRLSSPGGEESAPRFSPDGRRIAFTGNYDGNSDIYVIDVLGGLLTRVTHHPAPDRMLAWYPDGAKILYASSMQSGSRRFNQLQSVSALGGLPEKLPLPFAEMAALADDAERVAFTFTRRQGSWSRYRGGTAPDIWLFNLRTLESRNLTLNAATDDAPMWHGDGLYFLSDRGVSKRFNLWFYSLVDETIRQITHFEKVDVRSASIGPLDIVFEANGRLHVLNLDSQEHHIVEVDVVTDLSTLKPLVIGVGKLIEDVAVSPSGKRVVASARGELFSVPEEHGPIINLTQSSGVAERYPALSPDGKSLAYWTDRDGEYQLAVRPAAAPGNERIVTSLGPGYRYHLSWSPDSERVAFIDEKQQIWICRLEDSNLMEVDQARSWLHGSLQVSLQDFRPNWLSDSRWLTWSRLLDNGNAAVFVFDTTSGEKHQITAGFYSDHDPVFDPGGDYLFYLTEREMSAVYGSLDQEMWTYVNSTRIAALPLKPHTASPLSLRNDIEEASEEGAEDDSKESQESADQTDEETSEIEDTSEDGSNSKTDGQDEGDADDLPEPVEIEFEEMERRLVILPPRAGNYRGLSVTEKALFYLRNPNTGEHESKSDLLLFDFDERKEEKVLEDVNQFTLSSNLERILIRRQQQYVIVDAKKGQEFEKPLRTAKIEMRVDPRSEWQQMFSDSWRLYRDFFYDEALHGIDWTALRGQYSRLLQDAVTRWDVNHVIGGLISEVNASHVRLGGGDTEDSRSLNVGMLGVDWALDQDAYRIREIIRGASWDATTRSPVDQPGIEIAEGDYVLAVNYQTLVSTTDPWASFAGLANQTVSLSVNSSPTLDGAREVLVKTMSWSSEAGLRHLAWVEANRKRVEEGSNGKVGYIYMPNTSDAGQDNLMRQFKAQQDLPALIIDERFNAGGKLANRFLELLDRKPFAYLATRFGPDDRSPAVAHFGPQVMLINGWAGSGGDALPWYFKTAGRGPVIGVRTWGGLVGPAVGHRLIDGGSISVPPMRLYDPSGVWFTEGHGVDPDIEVPEDPSALARGTDTQLERAIQEALRLLDEPGRFLVPGTPAPEIR